MNNINTKIKEINSREVDFLDKYQEIYIQEDFNKINFDLRIKNLVLDYKEIDTKSLINDFFYPLIKENIAFEFKIPDYIKINTNFLEMVKKDKFFYCPKISFKFSLHIEHKTSIERDNSILILGDDNLIKLFKESNDKTEFIKEFSIKNTECIAFDLIENFVLYASKKELYLFDIKSGNEINKKELNFEIENLFFDYETKKHYINYGNFCRELYIKNYEIIIGDDFPLDKIKKIGYSSNIKNTDVIEKKFYSPEEKISDFVISPDENYFCYTSIDSKVTKLISLKKGKVERLMNVISNNMFFSDKSNILIIEFTDNEHKDIKIKYFNIKNEYYINELLENFYKENFEIKINNRSQENTISKFNKYLIFKNLDGSNINNMSAKEVKNSITIDFIDNDNFIYFNYIDCIIYKINIKTNEISKYIENKIVHNLLNPVTVKNIILSPDQKYIVFECVNITYIYDIAKKDILNPISKYYSEKNLKFSSDSKLMYYQKKETSGIFLYFLETENFTEIKSIKIEEKKFQLSANFDKIFVLDEVKNQIISRDTFLIYNNNKNHSNFLDIIQKIERKEILGYFKFENFITIIYKDKILTFKNTSNGAKKINEFHGENFSGEFTKTSLDLEIFAFDDGFIIKKENGKVYGSENWKDYVYFIDGDEIKDYPKWESYFDAVWDSNIFEEL